jgi:WD40 repeat protein
VAFSPDGKTLASGSRVIRRFGEVSPDTIKLWDAHSGQLRATVRGYASSVTCLAYSPDGKTLASGGGDVQNPSTPGEIKLWDGRSGQERASLKGHAGTVYCVVFSPDGKTLASGSEDNTIKLWDAATGQVRATLKGHDRSVHCVAFRPDGKTLASGSADDTIKLWDVATGQNIDTAKQQNTVTSVAFSPDGKTLASGSYRAINLWDLQIRGVERAALTLQKRAALEGSGPLCFSPDGKILAAGSGTIRLWDAPTGKERAALKGHERNVLSVAFSPDGRILASASADETIKVWSLDVILASGVK